MESSRRGWMPAEHATRESIATIVGLRLVTKTSCMTVPIRSEITSTETGKTNRRTTRQRSTTVDRFSRETERRLGRKVTMHEAPLSELTDEEVEEAPAYFFDGTERGLDLLCQNNNCAGHGTAFVAFDRAAGVIFVVQSEGYSYARYLGRLTRHQTERIGGRLTRRESFFSKKEPGEYDDDMDDGR